MSSKEDDADKKFSKMRAKIKCRRQFEAIVGDILDGSIKGSDLYDHLRETENEDVFHNWRCGSRTMKDIHETVEYEFHAIKEFPEELKSFSLSKTSNTKQNFIKKFFNSPEKNKRKEKEKIRRKCLSYIDKKDVVYNKYFKKTINDFYTRVYK